MIYDKILIIGIIGSGKTTLAKKLSKILKTKPYELDNIAYKRRDIYEKNKPKIRDKKVKSILKKKRWVVEGFYARYWTYPFYKKADIVIILNIKPSVAKRRVIKRYIKRRFFPERKTNANLKRTLKILKYVEEYPKKYFKMQKETAKEFNKKVLVLKNDKEIKQLFSSSQ